MRRKVLVATVVAIVSTAVTVAGASPADLAAVGGVSETLAKKIFDFFHPGG